MAYIPETVMNCDVDCVNKPEKYKCLGNTIDGNIFNKHNDQEKKTLVKMIFFTCMEFIQFMYAMNIQNDVIGLVLRENCKSKQMTDIIA